MEQELIDLKRSIEQCPPGHLLCVQNGKYIKCFLKEDSTGKLLYIKKSDQELIHALAKKKYLTAKLEDLQREHEALQAYFIKRQRKKGKLSHLLSPSSSYQHLLTTSLDDFEAKQKDWLSASYDTNPNYKEQLIHKSISGNILRSKSESLIDMLLYSNHIPYRYECKLMLDNTAFYPDFTIMQPGTGNILYWEHFGMMDSPSYVENTYSKLKYYGRHHIVPNINLITTFETKNHPLTLNEIEKVINHFILNQ